MRIFAVLGTVGGVLLRGYLASMAGYGGWFFYHLLQGSLWRWFMLILLPLSLLAMALTSLPVALLGSALARLAVPVTGVGRWPAMLLGLAAAGLAGAFLFIWYMTLLLPLVDWRIRWPWPLAASLLAYLLEWLWLGRRPPAAS